MSMLGLVASVSSEEVLIDSSWCVEFGGSRPFCWVELGYGGGERISVMVRICDRPEETCLIAIKVKMPEGWISEDGNGQR